MRGDNLLQRVHFTVRDTAESFGIDVSEEILCESQRSKSKEHTDRFAGFENFQKNAEKRRKQELIYKNGDYSHEFDFI